MSTLRPARLWEIKDLEKKRRGADTKGKVDQWYPTPTSLEFLPEGERSKKAVTRWYKETIKRCREDVNAFIEFVMHVGEEWVDPEVRGSEFLRQAWFHKELQKVFDIGFKYPNRKDYRHVAVAVPRGHGKTVQVVIGRVLWELGRNPNLRIKIVCNIPETAAQRLAEIRDHIESNGYLHAVFPELKPAKKKAWNDHKLFVERSLISKDPSVTGHGILGSAVGGRCDLLIGDDVVDPTTALLSPAMRPKVKRAWWSTYMPMLTKKGRSWYLCTPWHKDDLSHELVTKSQYITFMTHVGADDETVWPELYSQEELKDKLELMGDIEYARAYRMEAASEFGSPIVAEWIQYFDPSGVSLTKVAMALSVDLAVGKKAGDFFVVSHFAVDIKEQILYALMYYKGRIPYPEQREKIRQWAFAKRPNWIVVEAVSFQEVFADEIRNNPEMGEYRSAVCKFHPKVSKRARLEAISPWVKSGGIKFARCLAHPGGSHPDMVRQIVDFGIEPHDDVADTVSQMALFLHNKLGFWKPKGQGGVTVKRFGGRRLRRRR